MSGFLTLIALGFSLSVDAFAAALGKGAGSGSGRFLDALRIGAVFGAMEAGMPVIGYMVGLVLAAWMQPIDHWIAFGLLFGVGFHMIFEAFRGDSADETAANAVTAIETAPGDAGRTRWIRLALAATATSIDASVVGVSLAVMDVNIVAAVIVIGIITTAMATFGVLVGRKAGSWMGHYAEATGGAVLIIIGALIVWQHLAQGI